MGKFFDWLVGPSKLPEKREQSIAEVLRKAHGSVASAPIPERSPAPAPISDHRLVVPWNLDNDLLIEDAYRSAVPPGVDPTMSSTQWEDLRSLLLTLTASLPPVTLSGDPNAKLLLALPSHRDLLVSENHRLDRVVEQAIEHFETGRVEEPGPLLLQGRVSSVAGVAKFRPAHSSTTYETFGDNVPRPGRCFMVTRVAVIETHSGPEILLYPELALSDEDLTAKLAAFPMFPGVSQTQSLMARDRLNTLLNFSRYRLAPDVSKEVEVQFAADMKKLLGKHIDPDAPYDEAAKERVSSVVQELFSIPPLELFDDDDEDDRHGATLPEPRLVKTPRDAEYYAAEVMVGLGFTGVRVTPVGPDGGIDVEADDAVAQVKFEGRPSSRQQLQQLSGVAHVRGDQALFFSLGGYTSSAREWAHETGMALFEFAYDGSIEAISWKAEHMLVDGA